MHCTCIHSHRTLLKVDLWSGIVFVLCVHWAKSETHNLTVHANIYALHCSSGPSNTTARLRWPNAVLFKALKCNGTLWVFHRQTVVTELVQLTSYTNEIESRKIKLQRKSTAKVPFLQYKSPRKWFVYNGNRLQMDRLNKCHPPCSQHPLPLPPSDPL